MKKQTNCGIVTNQQGYKPKKLKYSNKKGEQVRLYDRDLTEIEIFKRRIYQQKNKYKKFKKDNILKREMIFEKATVYNFSTQVILIISVLVALLTYITNLFYFKVSSSLFTSCFMTLLAYAATEIINIKQKKGILCNVSLLASMTGATINGILIVGICLDWEENIFLSENFTRYYYEFTIIIFLILFLVYIIRGCILFFISIDKK